jgi:hypothetical protein
VDRDKNAIGSGQKCNWIGQCLMIGTKMQLDRDKNAIGSGQKCNWIGQCLIMRAESHWVLNNSIGL